MTERGPFIQAQTSDWHLSFPTIRKYGLLLDRIPPERTISLLYLDLTPYYIPSLIPENLSTFANPLVRHQLATPSNFICMTE